MTDLAIRPDVAVVHPQTGEIVPLDSGTDVLADWLDQVRDLESRLREMKGAVSRELLARMDREAKWTHEIAGFVVKGDGPGLVEYDAEALKGALDELVEAGDISQAAADQAVNTVTTLKTRAAGVNALRKLGGHIAAAVEDCSYPKDQRRVTVKRVA